MHESSIKSLKFIYRGKVRDLYEIDQQHMLMVATDRLSAFDVILPTPIPDKGKILTAISNFWFAKLAPIVPNHLTGVDPTTVVAAHERDQVIGRAVVVKRLQALPIEAVVRGYIEGSGWKDYQETGAICGIALPAGLQRAQKLPAPIFTPATKAAVGDHDENISFDAVEKLIGVARAHEVRDVTLKLYQAASEFALTKGIMIADTKFEFGLDTNGTLTLMDEALTPDSSRFWPAIAYQVGTSPESFDKQFVRNWLESINFNKKPPAPAVPADVAQKTADKYREALNRLTG